MQRSGNFRLIGLVVMVGVFVFIVMSSPPENAFQYGIASSYSTAFQGPQAKFYGIEWNNLQYTAYNTHGASYHTFDTTLTWDPDGNSSGKPKLNGQMTAVFLPEDSLNAAPSWVPISWLQNNGLISQDSQNGITGPSGANPPYTWNITGNAYVMKEFDMRYYVALSSSWSGSENPAPDVPDPILGGGGYGYNVFTNAQVWLHFDISPSWYIQGGGKGYFAIAELSLAENAQMQSKDNNGVTYAARTDEQVNPDARQAVVSLYYNAFGTNTASNSDPYTYDGKELNPAYFTSDLYAHIDLTNFGTWAGASNGLWTYTRGDVVTFGFDMKVFVVGDYTVQDIQQNPSQFGYTTPIQNAGMNWLSGIISWLSSPVNDYILIGIVLLAIVIIFAPWLLVVIVSLFAGGRRR